MKVLIINGSPKVKGGASRYIGKLLKTILFGCEVTTVDVCNTNKHDKAIGLLEEIDTLVFSVPLYNDSIPAHLIPFLVKVEKIGKERGISFSVYAVSNGGFVEGIQNKVHLQMYEAWCKRANLSWSGGLGIGGGVMFHVMSILFPILLAVAGIQVGAEIVQTGSITFSSWLSMNSGVLFTLIMSIGVYLNLIQLSNRIRKQTQRKNQYTRVLLPSFLFLIIADIFMGICYLVQVPGRVRLHLRQAKIVRNT